MLFILLCFSLLCSYFVWAIMLFDPEGCCCLIQMDGIFFVFFLCLMIFFCIFVLSDLLFFSGICFLW